MILWEGIDPREAESRMRGLLRRLSELDEALKAAQHIRAFDPDSFSAELSLASLSHLQERLEQERLELVKYRTREALTVSLSGHSYADHTAGVGELGVFLIRLQKLYSSIAQAITTGPRRRGPLSNEIVNATAMRFADVFPSSFGMEIFIRPRFDVFGESTAVSTLETLFALLNATKQEKEISRLSGELGQRAVAHLRHVLDDLSRSHAGFSLQWVDMTGTKFTWAADTDQIPALQSNVSKYRTKRSVEISLRAVLLGASLLRDRFELIDERREIIEGKLAREVKARLRDYFGRQCVATLEKVEIDEAVTGEVRTFYTLVGIDPLPSKPE
ncbi:MULTISPECIES: hypothetical protein [Bradyrhizobium]|uniref:hypothetical protein n=1 Tax=Bradyrhizobium TaxID=374 RepID=UPI00155E21E6|nr:MULTISPECIES: hypothetical protein [Bradyrhizobium]MDD1519985.1 hypothetical protein [Bradyrhizobium sp. WBAH30]MDD1544229.1 hypothetical protein [Bradyrhizobium sp. WBAH41]MDD1558111.1 hypothetical protein [Bradyrhizobium sp. WBAH23]MDD1565509.1 hypothetical protein [Bradyrhizobium sp. WBAH33]MDD1590639.1 hypothetical protein [Bradyrhizobium sp. WBAH42]